MLILLRKAGDSIQLGDNIRIFLIKVKGSKVKLGIEAPRHIKISEEQINKSSISTNKPESRPLKTMSPLQAE